MAEEKTAQNNEPRQNDNELRKVRLDKLQAFRDAGRDPFVITTAEQDMHTSDVTARFDELEGKDVSLCGRIMSKRPMGKAAFMNIADRDGRMQVYVRRDDIGEDEYAFFKKYDIGDIVEVKGFVFKTQTGEISVHAKSVRLLSKSLLPLPEK